jgi:hypothetical protein
MQFFGIFSDLITALIVYCCYNSKGKIMAIFCLINAVIGIIYTISIGSSDLNKLDKPQIQKNPYNDNMTNPNNFSNMNNNNFYYLKNDLSSRNIPNKVVYGIDDINNKNDYPSNKVNQLNNNYNTFGNPNNENVDSNSESRTFSFVYILSVTIYSMIVYSAISYYSYKAYHTYKYPFGEIVDDPENQNNYITDQNYGVIDISRNNNRRNLNQIAPVNNINFVPFNGPGQILG